MTPTTQVEATDGATKLARELGVDLEDVKPTGKDGQIIVADVRKAAPRTSSSSSWPSKGYGGSQPWEEGFELPDPDDQASAIGHARPLLTSGSAGPEVAALCELLERAGYPTSFSKGENPFSVLDASVLAAVESFRTDYGVREDPSAFNTPQAASAHVGPWTWEALHRVVSEA